MDQHIFLKILIMIVVITCGYKNCYNASLLIYRRYKGDCLLINKQLMLLRSMGGKPYLFSF